MNKQTNGGAACYNCGTPRDAGDLEMFSAGPNVDAVALCAACAKVVRDTFCKAVAKELGRPLSDDERELVWGDAHTEYSASLVASRVTL